MGKLVGLPEWLAQTLFVIGFAAIWFGIAARNTRRRIRQLVANRPNLGCAEFLTMMQPDVSDETSRFLWDKAMFYVEGRGVTPHPDDLLHDLPIDEDDWSMDWPREFAERRGFPESDLPEWPESWSTTLRNYGRWLDMGSASNSVSDRPRADGQS